MKKKTLTNLKIFLIISLIIGIFFFTQNYKIAISKKENIFETCVNKVYKASNSIEFKKIIKTGSFKHSNLINQSDILSRRILTEIDTEKQKIINCMYHKQQSIKILAVTTGECPATLWRLPAYENERKLFLNKLFNNEQDDHIKYIKQKITERFKLTRKTLDDNVMYYSFYQKDSCPNHKLFKSRKEYVKGELVDKKLFAGFHIIYKYNNKYHLISNHSKQMHDNKDIADSFHYYTILSKKELEATEVGKLLSVRNILNHLN